MEEKPKLRQDIEIIPGQMHGKKVVIIKDALGLLENPVVLSSNSLEMLLLLDGKRTVRDIQVAMMRYRGGILVRSDEIEKVLNQLDQYFLLDNERYRKLRDQIISEFTSQKIRYSSNAGISFPGARQELREFIDEILSYEPENKINLVLSNKQIQVLVAPHIDIQVAYDLYALSYKFIQGLKPELIIILGTGHSMLDGYFCLTKKDFETPLGIAKTNKKLVEKLSISGKDIITKDDFPHKKEHSIEFQLIFLQYLFKPDISILPILCGSFSNVLGKYKRPMDIPGVDKFLITLKEIIKNYRDKVLIVAGVDFSHIGPKFGDRMPAEFIMKSAKKHDNDLINALCDNNVEQFWNYGYKVEDKYHVCGFSTLACLLEILPEHLRGNLLDYDMWYEETTQSAVGFSSIIFS